MSQLVGRMRAEPIAATAKAMSVAGTAHRSHAGHAAKELISGPASAITTAAKTTEGSTTDKFTIMPRSNNAGILSLSKIPPGAK